MSAEAAKGLMASVILDPCARLPVYAPNTRVRLQCLDGVFHRCSPFVTVIYFSLFWVS